MWGKFTLPAGTGEGAKQTITLPIPYTKLLTYSIAVDNAASGQIGIIFPSKTQIAIQKSNSDLDRRTGSWSIISLS